MYLQLLICLARSSNVNEVIIFLQKDFARTKTKNTSQTKTN